MYTAHGSWSIDKRISDAFVLGESLDSVDTILIIFSNNQKMAASIYVILRLLLFVVGVVVGLAVSIHLLIKHAAKIRHPRATSALLAVFLTGMMGLCLWECGVQVRRITMVCNRARVAASRIAYKAASFKTWLLFDTPDTYYTPPRLSKAIFCWRIPAEPNEKIRKYLAGAGIRMEDMGTGETPPPSNTEIGKLPQVTNRAPGNKPWVVDYSHDINEFMEGLDLKPLAERCYEGKKGKIYFLDGWREIETLESGTFRYSPSTANTPAQLLTADDLDLSILMENIWLLYQLSLDGWVELDGSQWKWTAKAQQLTPSIDASDGKTLANLDAALKTRYKILQMICEASKSDVIPAIPCEIYETDEPTRAEDDEIRVMRKYYEGNVITRPWLYFESETRHEKGVRDLGDGISYYIVRWKWAHDIANKPEHGKEIYIGKGRKRYEVMELDDQYTEKRSIAQYVQYLPFSTVDDPLGWQGNKIHNGKLITTGKEREATLIYSH